MGLTAVNIKVGTELTPLVKHMTLQKMTWFSSGEGTPKQPNLHTDAGAAERDTGMKQPFASGRMSLGYASELMSRFVGLDVFSRTGTVDLKNIKPVMPGDTISVHGRVTQIKPVNQGSLVTVAIYCENQKGEKTSVGDGSAVVPSNQTAHARARTMTTTTYDRSV